MNYLRERVSYLKGLAEGMKIDDTSNEGKLLKAIIDVLDDVAMSVDDMDEIQEELSRQVDNIDEDLAEIESVLFDGDIEDFDDLYVDEIECPSCNEIIELNDDVINENELYILCPHCNEKMEIDSICDCEDHE